MARILRRTHSDRHLRRIIKNQEQIIRRLVRLETRLVRLAVKSGVDVTVQGRQQPCRPQQQPYRQDYRPDYRSDHNYRSE